MKGEHLESKTRAIIGLVADDLSTTRSEWPLTVGEIAQRLRVGRRWVYEHADQLGAYRLGKYLRFDWGRVMERLRSGALAAAKLGSQPNDLPEDQ